MTKLSKILIAAFATFALFACVASATTHTFTINLTVGQAESPTGTGSGTGTASYDDVTGYFLWDYEFTVGGTASSAHFHGPAAAGVHGAAVQVTVPSPAMSPNSNMGMPEMLTAAQGQDLINGLWYLNIHTSDAVPSGEIRGQLVNDNPPTVVDNTAEKTSLQGKIKKLKKKIKKATGPKAKKLKKKLKKLKKKLKALG